MVTYTNSQLESKTVTALKAICRAEVSKGNSQYARYSALNKTALIKHILSAQGGSSQAQTPPAQTPPRAEAQTGGFLTGETVLITGLKNKRELNGQTGVVQGYDSSTGRYTILTSTGEGAGYLNIRPANLTRPGRGSGKPPCEPEPSLKLTVAKLTQLARDNDIHGYSGPQKKGGKKGLYAYLKKDCDGRRGGGQSRAPPPPQARPRASYAFEKLIRRAVGQMLGRKAVIAPDAVRALNEFLASILEFICTLSHRLMENEDYYVEGGRLKYYNDATALEEAIWLTLGGGSLAASVVKQARDQYLRYPAGALSPGLLKEFDDIFTGRRSALSDQDDFTASQQIQIYQGWVAILNSAHSTGSCPGFFDPKSWTGRKEGVFIGFVLQMTLSEVLGSAAIGLRSPGGPAITLRQVQESREFKDVQAVIKGQKPLSKSEIESPGFRLYWLALEQLGGGWGADTTPDEAALWWNELHPDERARFEQVAEEGQSPDGSNLWPEIPQLHGDSSSGSGDDGDSGGAFDNAEADALPSGPTKSWQGLNVDQQVRKCARDFCKRDDTWKKCYRRAVLKWHPDKWKETLGVSKEVGEDWFKFLSHCNDKFAERLGGDSPTDLNQYL